MSKIVCSKWRASFLLFELKCWKETKNRIAPSIRESIELAFVCFVKLDSCQKHTLTLSNLHHMMCTVQCVENFVNFCVEMHTDWIRHVEISCNWMHILWMDFPAKCTYISSIRIMVNQNRKFDCLLFFYLKTSESYCDFVG